MGIDRPWTTHRGRSEYDGRWKRPCTGERRHRASLIFGLQYGERQPRRETEVTQAYLEVGVPGRGRLREGPSVELEAEAFRRACRCQVTVATWNLPLTDLLGHKAAIMFHIVKGDDALSLGNNVISVSTLVGADNLLLIPENVVAPVKISLPTYPTGESNCLRTMLHVVPAQSTQLKTLLSSSAVHSPVGSPAPSLGKQAKAARVLAVKLHTFTHLTARDMKMICSRAGVLNPILSQALELVVQKCTSCKRSGRPLHSRKVSFARVLSGFTDHLQADFLFIKELQNIPILHIVDVGTGFSATALMSSRDMEDASRMIKTKLFHVHGPPPVLSGDPEFDNRIIRRLCADAEVEYAARPARMHYKIGSVESANATIRLFVQPLVMDDEHQSRARGTKRLLYEILSHARFLKNVLYGGKQASSFELARGSHRPYMV